MPPRILLSLLALLGLVAGACAAERPHEFALKLEPLKPRFSAGTTPSFRLTLTNVSAHPVRILNIEKRVDLQHTYYDLIVTKGGKEVPVGRAISDPGWVPDSIWLKIAPGESKTFTLKSFPQDYRRLRPGSYEAFVRFWRDPMQSHTTAYCSEVASFTVTK